MVTRGDSERVTVGRLFSTRAFVVPYIAESQSIIGDQLARFALAVVVLNRTNSVLASALTYATTYAPAILGGFALGRVGDRFERTRVMVAVDLARAALFLAMSVPTLPIWALILILAVAVFLGPAYSAAEVGYLSVALGPEEFRLATAIRSASNQMAQVAGFAVGGVIVVWLRPDGALLLNAATFMVSAALVAIGLRRNRPRVVAVSTPVFDGPTSADRFAGLWTDAQARSYMILTVVLGLFVLPEALAVPFGRQIAASEVEIGLLVATLPLGSALGAALIARVPAHKREWTASVMAALCGIPLLVSAFEPSWPLACVCWFASGIFAAYQVEAITVLVGIVPEARRSHLLGVVGAWLLGGQGIAFALGGLIAQALNPGASIAILAGVGTAVAIVRLCATGSAGLLARA